MKATTLISFILCSIFLKFQDRVMSYQIKIAILNSIIYIIVATCYLKKLKKGNLPLNNKDYYSSLYLFVNLI